MRYAQLCLALHSKCIEVTRECGAAAAAAAVTGGAAAAADGGGGGGGGGAVIVILVRFNKVKLSIQS